MVCCKNQSSYRGRRNEQGGEGREGEENEKGWRLEAFKAIAWGKEKRSIAIKKSLKKKN